MPTSRSGFGVIVAFSIGVGLSALSAIGCNGAGAFVPAQANCAVGFAGFGNSRIGVTALYCSLPDFGKVAGDALADRLVQAGLPVVERSYIERLAAEEGLQLSASADQTSYSRIAQVAKVGYLVVGTISASDEVYSSGVLRKVGTAPMVSGASARIIDASTGQVVVSATYHVGKGWEWHKPTTVGNALGDAIANAVSARIVR